MFNLAGKTTVTATPVLLSNGLSSGSKLILSQFLKDGNDEVQKRVYVMAARLVINSKLALTTTTCA
jgi:hypothetical protein